MRILLALFLFVGMAHGASRIGFTAALQGTNAAVGGGGGYTDPPGLAIWYKADSTASISASDGDPISTLTDISGHTGRDATQAGATRPIYKVNIQNGKPGVAMGDIDIGRERAISRSSELLLA